MFTGLIEELGAVASLVVNDQGAQLQLTAAAIAQQLRDGESVAVNGCCLTVTSRLREQVTFDLLAETLARTNLGSLGPSSSVNLERALAAGDRLGGHFVQGHIDCTARVISFASHSADYRLEIKLPSEFAQYVAFKGSVALNGISLTVAEVLSESFVVWVIPHTYRHTNLRSIRAGDLLNVEFDLLAKYVERMLERTAKPQ